MKNIFLVLIFPITFQSYSQVYFHIPAVFRDSNYLGIRIAENMSTNTSLTGFKLPEEDSDCLIKNYYFNISFAPGITSSKLLSVLFCKKGNAYKVVVDLNQNKNFKDDSVVTLIDDHIHNKYHFKLDFNNPQIAKRSQFLNLTLELINIQTTESNGKSYSKIFLNLVHSCSIFATFTLDNSVYQVEAIPKYLNNGTGESSIGLSEPNTGIKKMNIERSIFPHRLRNDTIISGNFKFIIDSVDFFNNIISLTAWPMTEKDYGYNIANRIRNYSLHFLEDTSQIISLSNSFQNAHYLLIDFWGSWCSPCIKNIPFIEKINQDSKKLNLKIIGIACERKDNPSAAFNILKGLNVSYDNFFVNTNKSTGQDLLNNLDMLAFPTYILLDKDLKIVMRETNIEGIEKIKKFLESQIK